MENLDVRCACCKKKPDKIEEYVEYAKDENITPEAYVIDNEGTYNPKTGKFYCTSCYIKVGMPLGRCQE